MQDDETNPVTAMGEQAAQEISRTASESTSALMETFWSLLVRVLEVAPNILAAIVILAVGYVLSRLLGRGIGAIADKMGLQKAAENSGLSESMKQAGVERTVPQIIGVIVFWMLMSVFIVASFDVLNLPGVAGSIEKVVAYIPKVLVATVLVVVGLLLAAFLRGLIATSADRAGLSYAQQLASACYYILAIMTFIAAFEQLEIKFELLNYAILIAFGAIAIALGLSIGLGGREVMAGILCGYYLRQRFQAGDQVRVAGYEGTVREVGPVATIVETEEDGMLHRHSVPNSMMLNEAVR